MTSLEGLSRVSPMSRRQVEQSLGLGALRREEERRANLEHLEPVRRVYQVIRVQWYLLLKIWMPLLNQLSAPLQMERAPQDQKMTAPHSKSKLVGKKKKLAEWRQAVA